MLLKLLGLAGAGLLLALPVSSALAADITGRWNVEIVSATEGQLHGVAGFSQNRNDVTGWLGPSESDPIPITLRLKGNKLTIWTHPQPGRTVAFGRCDVTVDGDKMSGTIDKKKGTIEFIRVSYDRPPAAKFKPGN